MFVKLSHQLLFGAGPSNQSNFDPTQLFSCQIKLVAIKQQFQMDRIPAVDLNGPTISLS